MPLQITNTSTESESHGAKIIVYGRSGVGKTVLARTCPQPVVILAAEPGLLSLSKKNQLRLFGDYVDMDVWKVTTVHDLNDALALLERPDCPYATVFMDSASEIGETVLAHAKSQYADKRQAYGEMQDKMVELLKAYRDLKGKHVIFIAKQMANKEGCTPLEVPAMPGTKLGPATPYLVDEVLHLDIGELPEGGTYRFLQTQPSVQFDAKDRSGSLDHVEQPNLSVVISKLLN